MYYEDGWGNLCFRPGNTMIFDDYCFDPANPCDYDSVARRKTEELSNELNSFQRKILEEEKAISVQLSNISNEISETIESCTNTLSDSIYKNSEKIIFYLRQISDESEYNTMLSEYYLLQQKIEQYEDYCIENNIFKEVHEQLEELEHKHYIDELSEREIVAIFALLGNHINIIGEIMKSRLVSPIDAIKLFCNDYRFYAAVPHNLRHSSDRTTSNIWAEANQCLFFLEADYKDVYTYPVIISHINAFQKTIRYCNAKIALYNLRNEYEILRTTVRNHKKHKALSE